MKPLSLAHDIHDHFKKLQSIIKKLDGHFSETDVHHFRVEIKKLRALLRLANTGSHSPNSLTAPLHTFYMLAGRIRNIQLQHRHLLLYAEQHQQLVPASCTEIMGHRLAAAVVLAQHYMDKHPILEKLPARLPETISVKRSEKFIHHRLQPFQYLSFDPLRDEEKLHTLRKSLKDLLYAWPYLATEARHKIEPGSLKTKKAIDSIASLLGEYQNIRLCLELFRDEDFLLTTGETAKPFLQAVSKAWLDDRNTLLQKIDAVLFPDHTPIPVTPVRHIHAHRVVAEASITDIPQINPENPISPPNLTFESYELHVD